VWSRQATIYNCNASKACRKVRLAILIFATHCILNSAWACAIALCTGRGQRVQFDASQGRCRDGIAGPRCAAVEDCRGEDLVRCTKGSIMTPPAWSE
jgi:hypothetical protein